MYLYIKLFFKLSPKSYKALMYQLAVSWCYHVLSILIESLVFLFKKKQKKNKLGL